MPKRPVIGINIECPLDRYARTGFSDLRLPHWLDCIAQAGAIPVAVPPLDREADVACLLDRLHAFVYAGCRDLDPQSQAYDPEAGEADPAVQLIRTIAERRMPFLGIGTGIQLLNVALGGTLRSVRSGDETAVRHTHPHNPRHFLKTTNGSFLRKVLPATSTLVSSIHEAAVDDVAVGLAVSARCPDGLVEGIESETSDWIAVGVQFLPEPDTADLDLRVFRAFVQDVQSHQLQLV